MSLKLKKLAVATAAAISLGAAGQAQSGDLLFPYIVVGPTVTTLMSVINTNTRTPGNNLQYQIWYKSGNGSEPSNADACLKSDYALSTSPMDIQTFDIGDKFDNELGVVFRDASANNRWRNSGTYILQGVQEPLRAFLVIDDVQATPNEARSGDPRSRANGLLSDNALYGEAFVIEFQSGAVWGYQAGRAPSGPANVLLPGVAPRHPADVNLAPEAGDFRLASAGVAIGPLNPVDDTARWVQPMAIMPPTDVQTRLFVTPLVQNMRTGNLSASGFAPTAADPLNRANGQAWVELDLGPVTTRNVVGGGGGTTHVRTAIYDRDEVPLSGSQPQLVRCVGAVDPLTMLSSATLGRITADNRTSDIGWGWLSARGVVNAGGAILPASTEVSASVIKLEFNEGTSFLGRNLGTFNNAYQLTNGQWTGPNPVFAGLHKQNPDGSNHIVTRTATREGFSETSDGYFIAAGS